MTNDINDTITLLKDENPFAEPFQPLSPEDKDALNEVGLSGLDTEPFNIFTKETYDEIAKCIYADLYCEAQLKQYCPQISNPDADLSDMDSIELKKDFDMTFQFLIDVWHKFTPDKNRGCFRNYFPEEDDFPFVIFQIIYKHWPLFCTEAFPTVIFIIADSFYKLYNQTRTDKKKLSLRNLNEERNIEKVENVFHIFKDILEGGHLDEYMLSLFNSKGIEYNESSIKAGGEIHARIRNEFDKYHNIIADCLKTEKDFEDYFEYSAAESKALDDLKAKDIINQGKRVLKNRFEDSLPYKQNTRLKYKKDYPKKFPYEKILVGENFLAFLNLLQNLPSKRRFNPTLTLYSINKITGWVTFSLLDDTLSITDFSHCRIYLPPDMLFTTHYLAELILQDPDYDRSKAIKIPFLCTDTTWIRRLFSDARKLYSAIRKEIGMHPGYHFLDKIDKTTLDMDTDCIYKMLVHKYNAAVQSLQNKTGSKKKPREEIAYFDLERTPLLCSSYFYLDYVLEMIHSETD